MHCIDSGVPRRLHLLATVALTAWLGGCAQPPAVPPPANAAAKPAATAGSGPAPVLPGAARAAAPRVLLPAPTAARDWDEFKLQAARRLVAANPTGTYMTEVPDPLLAIPVLEIELARDGSVRRIHVLRQPSQALDTIQLAIDAVHRAAPFGDMSRLSPPWTYVEVFLFDDDRLFKPRTLDD